MGKRILILLAIVVALLGCATDADIASQNLPRAAEQFEITRRIVFYNGITDTYILSVEGQCSVDFYTEKFTVTCRIGENKFLKHYLGRADNVFPFVEQLDAAKVGTFHYRVIFKPQSILPNIDPEVSLTGN